MSRSRKFSPATEAEIVRRRAAGESTPSIAKSLGTSHQNVQNALKRADPSGPGGTDEFEQAQLDNIKLIKAELAKPKLKPAQRAMLTKSLNDSIKAVRSFRAATVPSEEDDDGVADLVMAKLKRLQEVGRMAAPVIEAPIAEPEKNGTEHS